MDDFHSFLPVLKVMLRQCKSVHALLQQDKDYFIKNAIDSIADSNQQKLALVHNLTILAEQLMTLQKRYPGKNFLTALEEEIASLDQKAQIEYYQLVDELK